MKIGIVEDELIIADSIVKIVTEMGYEVAEPAISYAEALQMLQDDKPDLVLIDIQIRGKRDGIDVARYIREHLSIPFIFLTANSDVATVARAKEVQPPAYLMKPFNRDDLYTSIEICLSNAHLRGAISTQKNYVNDFMFIKDGAIYHKVPINDILYLESDHVYINVVTANKKYLVRSSLQPYLENLDAKQFLRVHRGYAVNLKKVNEVGKNILEVDGHQIPISKTYKDDLLAALRLS